MRRTYEENVLPFKEIIKVSKVSKHYLCFKILRKILSIL